MFTCKTDGCSQKGVQHTAHPDGVTLYCGVCAQEMSEVKDA